MVLTAGQGIKPPRVGYLASDQFNRYRPEISHTSLDLFWSYRTIPVNANSDRKTTNGQIHCWKRFIMLPRTGLIVVSLKGHNFWSRTSCEVYNSDSCSETYLKFRRNFKFKFRHPDTNSDTIWPLRYARRIFCVRTPKLIKSTWIPPQDTPLSIGMWFITQLVVVTDIHALSCCKATRT